MPANNQQNIVDFIMKSDDTLMATRGNCIEVPEQATSHQEGVLGAFPPSPPPLSEI